MMRNVGIELVDPEDPSVSQNGMEFDKLSFFEAKMCVEGSWNVELVHRS